MRNKTVAALLALFLGGFGVHKFYLGQNALGIVYLIFFWSYIPALIAFFESIGLFLMSETAFNSQYNAHLINPNPVINLGLRNNNLNPRDQIATLTELKKLYDAGIITAEEYERKRRKYLDSL